MHICRHVSGTLSLCENILCPCVFVHIMPAVQSAKKRVRKTLRMRWLPAPSDRWADSTSLPQQLFHWLQLERVILDGCCSKHGLLQTGFQEWVTVCISPLPICTHPSATPLAHFLSPPSPFSRYQPFLIKYQWCAMLVCSFFFVHTEHAIR